MQTSSFGVKVVGYMIEAGYVIDEYQARAERRFVVRIFITVLFSEIIPIQSATQLPYYYSKAAHLDDSQLIVFSSLPAR